MKDKWKDLLWVIGFLIWLFGTPMIALYIIAKWQTLHACIIATIILIPHFIYTSLSMNYGGVVADVLAWIIAIFSFPWSWLILRFIPSSETEPEKVIALGITINALVILTILKLGGII